MNCCAIHTDNEEDKEEEGEENEDEDGNGMSYELVFRLTTLLVHKICSYPSKLSTIHTQIVVVN